MTKLQPFLALLALPVVAWSSPANAANNCHGSVKGLSAQYDQSSGSGFLAVRMGPDSDAQKVGELFNGDELQILEQQGKWLRVISGSGFQGWVYSKYVDVSCETSSASTSATAGSMTCDQVNRPHDPKPVRNWLRGFVSASGYSGQYQEAAGQIGAFCQEHPEWTLSEAAEYWKQEQVGSLSNEADVETSQQQNTQATAENTTAVDANTQATQTASQAIQENTAATEQVASAVSEAAQLSAKTADAMNKRITDLSAQIATLSKVLEEQKKQKDDATNEDEKATVEQTIIALNLRIEVLQKEFAEKDTTFNQYLTSITPNDRDLYLTARKASQLYPKVPYYIPGTNETGEFWVEPKVTDAGELMFNFRLIDPAAENDTTRSLINMNLEQLGETQKALFKLYKNSVIAHEKKIRENYTKRVICFPSEQCPEERQKGEKGKTSTEVVFMIYEDGSTGGRLQQNKGAFQEGVNFSIDSALLFQAYLSHVINEAKTEFESGTRTQEQLDEMFQ